MTDSTIQLLRDLIAIDSINPSLVPGGAGESEISVAVAQVMRSAGMDVQIREVETGPEFRAFKRVIRESELPENMADAPLILDLISDIERIRQTQPAERSRWDGIEF